jgi:hypothetical protein
MAHYRQRVARYSPSPSPPPKRPRILSTITERKQRTMFNRLSCRGSRSQNTIQRLPQSRYLLTVIHKSTEIHPQSCTPCPLPICDCIKRQRRTSSLKISDDLVFKLTDRLPELRIPPTTGPIDIFRVKLSYDNSFLHCMTCSPVWSYVLCCRIQLQSGTQIFPIDNGLGKREREC